MRVFNEHIAQKMVKIRGIGLSGAMQDVNNSILTGVKGVTNTDPTLDVVTRFQPVQKLDFQRQSKGNFDQAIGNASFTDKIMELKSNQEPEFNIHDRLRFSTSLPNRILANLMVRNGPPKNKRVERK